LLAEALLERFPQANLTGYDGSPKMLERAAKRLECFGERFIPCQFDLGQTDWRESTAQYQAVLSSLAIHHLDAAAKQVLYGDVWQMLLPGGVFLIADLVLPLGEQALAVAAAERDAAVRQCALELDGTLEAYEFFMREGWNYFRYPDEMDMPSPLSDQLRWLEDAGYQELNVFWTHAGHAVWGGRRPAGY
jgi:tRNA (cmo5U34)-methyltransferase